LAKRVTNRSDQNAEIIAAAVAAIAEVLLESE